MLRRNIHVASRAAMSGAFPALHGMTSSSQAATPLRPSVPYTTMRQFSQSKVLAVRGAGRSTSAASSSSSSSGGGGLWSMVPNLSPAKQSSGGGSQADALTPAVRQHMFRVYNLLAMGVGACAVGSSAMLMTPLGKMVPYWMPMVGGFVPLLWLMFKPPASVQGRLALFFAFTTIEGMAIAPIVKASAAKGVLGSALVMTGAVFVGFSCAALLAPRASLMVMQGPLMGMLFGMIAISILNMFYPTAFAHSIVLYGGLAIFSAFIAVDTQSMIERASCGGSDHVGDALQMFLNVLNIFIRLSAILRGD
jgi:FtsH-binding integral membrane protein